MCLGEEQVGVFLFEDLKRDSGAFLTKLNQFMGLAWDSSNCFSLGQPKNARLSQEAHRKLVAILASDHGAFLNQPLEERLDFLNRSSGGPASVVIPESWKSRIHERVAAGNQQLGELLGRSLEDLGYSVSSRPRTRLEGRFAVIHAGFRRADAQGLKQLFVGHPQVDFIQGRTSDFERTSSGDESAWSSPDRLWLLVLPRALKHKLRELKRSLGDLRVIFCICNPCQLLPELYLNALRTWFTSSETPDPSLRSMDAWLDNEFEVIVKKYFNLECIPVCSRILGRSKVRVLLAEQSGSRRWEHDLWAFCGVFCGLGFFPSERLSAAPSSKTLSFRRPLESARTQSGVYHQEMVRPVRLELLEDRKMGPSQKVGRTLHKAGPGFSNSL